MAKDLLQKLAEYKTVDEVAQLLGVNASTVLRWLNAGELVGFQLGKQWRIADSDIEDFINAQRRRQSEKIARRQAEKHAREELKRRQRYEPDSDLVIKLCDYCHEWPLVVDFGEWLNSPRYCRRCTEYEPPPHSYWPDRLPKPQRPRDDELADLPF